jgi:hypothetical protein
MTLIVHVGAPKTATSTLQNAFFPAHPELFFLGKHVDRARAHEGWRQPEIGMIIREIEASDVNFKPDLSAVQSIVAAQKAEAAGRTVVVSDEGLCVFTGADCIAKLCRIKELFDTLAPIRLILCVRDQLALIKSNYTTEHRGEMLRLSGTKQSWYPDFDQYLDIHFRYACCSFLDSFCYAAMIDRLEPLVGAENVLIYGFEEFKKDPIATLRRLCRFMKIDELDPCLEKTAMTRENEQYSARTYAVNRLRKRVLGEGMIGGVVPKWAKTRLRRWITSGARFEVKVSADAVRRIEDYYRADNEVLYLKHGIRL